MTDSRFPNVRSAPAVTAALRTNGRDQSPHRSIDSPTERDSMMSPTKINRVGCDSPTIGTRSQTLVTATRTGGMVIPSTMRAPSEPDTTTIGHRIAILEGCDKEISDESDGECHRGDRNEMGVVPTRHQSFGERGFGA